MIDTNLQIESHPLKRAPISIEIESISRKATYETESFLSLFGKELMRNASLEWAELIGSMKNCKKCTIRNEAIQVVPPEENLTAQVVFQGRNPGNQEDKCGRPFLPTAPGGKWFLKYLEALGERRQDVHITNSALCHTKNDRPPTYEELVQCSVWKVMEWVKLKNIRYLFLLGNDALRQTFGYDFPSIVRIFGTVYQTNIFGRDVMIFPCYHPAYAGRFPDSLAIDQFSFLKASRIIIEEDRKGNLKWLTK